MKLPTFGALIKVRVVNRSHRYQDRPEIHSPVNEFIGRVTAIAQDGSMFEMSNTESRWPAKREIGVHLLLGWDVYVPP